MPVFTENNKAAEKWTFEEAEKIFEHIFENARIDESVLCLQDAYLAIPLRGSSFHYLIEKFPVLERFKRDIQDVIISRVNKNALTNDFNSTAGIWRMKQLGEKDTQYQKLDATLDNITKLTPDQRAARIAELKAKLNAE